MKFMCFGGAAAVVDDEAAVEARHRCGRGRSLSFRGWFLLGKGGKKKPSPASSPLAADAKKKRGVGAGYDVYGASTASSSVPSSAPLSSAASLDSAASLSSCCSSSSVSSSSLFSGALPTPALAAERRARASTTSPAVGAAAVVLCLLMVVFRGRVGATLLTSMALYLFPRRWPVTACKRADDDVEEPPECDAVSTASEAEEETAKRKVVMDGFLVRNRKK